MLDSRLQEKVGFLSLEDFDLEVALIKAYPTSYRAGKHYTREEQRQYTLGVLRSFVDKVDYNRLYKKASIERWVELLSACESLVGEKIGFGCLASYVCASRDNKADELHRLIHHVIRFLEEHPPQ